MTQTIRRNDKDLQTAVIDELTFNPGIDAAHLVMLANNGVVTLSGEVASLPEWHAAKRAALRVAGVKALAEDMVVRAPGASGTTDADLASTANQMLNAALDVPFETVKAGVRDHIVTLSGTVTWQYQREAAARAVMYLRGVAAVANTIALTSTASATGAKSAIEAAVQRNDQVESREIFGPGQPRA
jgi:osmotically-inducible protein OsmY